MAVAHGIKLVAAISTIFGLIALAVSLWTFASIIVYHSHFEMRQDNSTRLVLSSEEEVSSVLPQYPYSEYHDSETISKLWARLADMTAYFRTVMIVCTWIVNIGALVQIGVAVGILVRIKKKISQGSKYLVGSHFGVFIVLLVCFFVPLSEDRTNNTQHTITTFNDVIMLEFETLSQVGVNYVWQDVHAYYFALSFDIGVLFITMITTCCLLRCETTSYESV